MSAVQLGFRTGFAEKIKEGDSNIPPQPQIIKLQSHIKDQLTCGNIKHGFTL